MSQRVAVAVEPQEELADRPFQLEWALYDEDDDGVITPEDTSDVVAVLITAELQVPRGVTPPDAKTWDLTSGVSLPVQTIDGQSVTVLTVTEGTGLAEGVYDIKASFTRGGVAEYVIKDTLVLESQP